MKPGCDRVIHRQAGALSRKASRRRRRRRPCFQVLQSKRGRAGEDAGLGAVRQGAPMRQARHDQCPLRSAAFETHITQSVSQRNYTYAVAAQNIFSRIKARFSPLCALFRSASSAEFTLKISSSWGSLLHDKARSQNKTSTQKLDRLMLQRAGLMTDRASRSYTRPTGRSLCDCELLHTSVIW
ncbi:hypothetical protein IE81DRAFT_189019 [Ceraceosorus guamensis]|uniref:Uncharacterized protein n=1 Tax=Ceraceosorus guamensis TaxID=1522189 RepID=A0A316W6X8_9BASI|nr:hypothetical protein IE81DRAFT_189019 [Ceraceosorus guamensis]PWN45364.1 hypothetical protein IE81DRAFT_189019 [Ceraceosorus guamensis]